MRAIDVKRGASNCQKCSSCIGMNRDACAMHGEYENPSFSPPALFCLADIIVDGDLKPTMERSITPFACTMCGGCSHHCHNPYIYYTRDYPTQLIEGVRELFVEEGSVPEAIGEVFRNMYNSKNAWGLPKSLRIEWEKKSDIPIPDYNKEQNEFLLFIGDSSLISETQHIPGVVAKLLQLGGLDFGTLKEEEVDSGNEIREMGERGLFEAIAEENIETFQQLGVKKIITLSPHDYHTFSYDYPEFGMEFDGIYHYTQIIDELIREGKIKPIKEITKTVTFQDPCHLGRYNEIYEAPRNIIEAVPGIKLIEMEQSHEKAFCCGGGGGRMWFDDPAEYRKNKISDIRVGHAKVVDAEVIATACPYCLGMLVTAGNLEGTTVKDIAELVLDSLGS